MRVAYRQHNPDDTGRHPDLGVLMWDMYLSTGDRTAPFSRDRGVTMKFIIIIVIIIWLLPSLVSLEGIFHHTEESPPGEVVGCDSFPVLCFCRCTVAVPLLRHASTNSFLVYKITIRMGGLMRLIPIDSAVDCDQ